MSSQTSQDQKDTAQFDKLGHYWWDHKGPMAPLHHFTPVRIAFLLDRLKRDNKVKSPKDKAQKNKTEAGPLQGLRILDIGCGGGLLAEPLARLGADMTAIDASAQAIKAAREHAANQGLTISYLNCLAEDLVDRTGDDEMRKFDLVYASEVIEHVADRSVFLRAMKALTKSDGLVAITTINRTMAALATVKIGAEYITGHIPKGTHQFEKFVKPSELQAEAYECGIIFDHLTGFVPSLGGGFRTSAFMGINYAACGHLR
ncbi:MAG: bifunctional 2-polyprenyl-6-hydroxyphenol methylase/3-demethylubiquinol 3-O-methyltransferase UbiG [Candidatus Puniceispirillaceae bacterium]